jgi:hypothetical protein
MMMSKKTPAVHVTATQNTRDPNWRDDLWSSLPTTAGRHGARLITRLQFDALTVHSGMEPELVDRWWEAGAPTPDAALRIFDRDGLADAMGDAALAAVASMPDEATGPVGPHKHVIRFITHPDFRVTHAEHVGDMTVEDTQPLDGDVDCLCVGVDLTSRWLPLSQLWPAGAVSAAMRKVVEKLMLHVTEDMVAQLLEAGALKKPDPEALPAVRSGVFARMGIDDPLPPGSPVHTWGGETIVDQPQSETTHHLGVHPEYVMDPKRGTSTSPTPPLPLDGQ